MIAKRPLLFVLVLLAGVAHADEETAAPADRILGNKSMGEGLAIIKAAKARAPILGGIALFGGVDVKKKDHPDTVEARQAVLVPLCRAELQAGADGLGLPVLVEVVFMGGTKCGMGKCGMGCVAVAVPE